jgi:LysR family transcriptional activator of nhaA
MPGESFIGLHVKILLFGIHYVFLFGIHILLFFEHHKRGFWWRACQKSPDLRCVVREGLPQELWAALGSHQVDVVIANEAPPPNLVNLPTGRRIGRMRVVFAASQELAKAFAKNPDPGALPVLAPARESVLRRELEQWWGAQEIKPVIRAEFDDAAAMFELAARGLGAAPIHEPVLKDICTRYGLVALPLKPKIEDELFVVGEKLRYAGEGVALLMELAEGILKA